MSDYKTTKVRQLQLLLDKWYSEQERLDMEQEYVAGEIDEIERELEFLEPLTDEQVRGEYAETEEV